MDKDAAELCLNRWQYNVTEYLVVALPRGMGYAVQHLYMYKVPKVDIQYCTLNLCIIRFLPTDIDTWYKL